MATGERFWVVCPSCQQTWEMGPHWWGCPTCRDPQLPARTRLLLTLLAPPPKPSLGAKAAWAGLTLARLAWLLRTAVPAPAATGSGGPALSDRAGSGSEP